HGAGRLFDVPLRALGRLRALDASLSFELLGLPLGLHLLVADHLAHDLLQLAAHLLCRALAFVALVAHGSRSFRAGITQRACHVDVVRVVRSDDRPWLRSCFGDTTPWFQSACTASVQT